MIRKIKIVKFKSCHKISNIVSTLIYVSSLPFLMLSFLYGTIPTFEIPINTLSWLFYTTVALVVIKIIMAGIVKAKLCEWAGKHNVRLTLRQLIPFL